MTGSGASLLVLLLVLSACAGHDNTALASARVTTIALTTTAVQVDPTQTLSVTATPRDSAGMTLTGRTVTWTSSRPDVATIDSNGLVRAIAGGTTTLTATIDGVTASVTIFVTTPFPPLPPPPPADADTVGGWTLALYRPLPSKYEGMSFPDSLHGWVVSDQGDVVATADGGVTWAQQARGLGLLRSLDFIDATHGFAGSLAGNLYHTADGGVTWTDIGASLPKPPIGFCGITHIGNNVHVVGRYIGATDYYSSPDGGVTWRYQNLSALMSGMVDVAFVDPATGFIGGTGPSSGSYGDATILKTTDGGVTWRTVFTHGGGPGWAWKIFPVTASIIYVSLESFDGTYRVAKSVDGGETWGIEIVTTGGTGGGLQGIGFLDVNDGWVGGFFTGMFATTDGGVTWSPVPVTSGNINRFRRVGNTLFTAGTQGVLRYVPQH